MFQVNRLYQAVNEDKYWKHSKSNWPFKWEYDHPKESHYTINYIVEMSFKTSVENGILFYSTHPTSQYTTIAHDFVCGYIKDGQVHHIFTTAPNTSVAVFSTETYNDNVWHVARFVKNKFTAEVCVDGDVECVQTTGQFTDSGSWAHLIPEIFIGGVSQTYKERAMDEVVRESHNAYVLN